MAKKQTSLTTTQLTNEVAVAIHTTVRRRTPSSLLTDAKEYSDTNLSDRGKVTALARKLRSNEGICASVADLLCDFAATQGMFYSDNVELKDALNKVADLINSRSISPTKNFIQTSSGLRSIIRKIIDSYITDGDAVFTVNWKSGIQAGEETYVAPADIKVFDSITLQEDEALAALGFEVLYLKLSDAVKDKITKPKTDADKELVKRLPKEWVANIKAKKDILLSPDTTYHIKRNGKDYKAWGESLFQKAFTAVANKRRIQGVEEAVLDGLINRFTIIKIGLADKEKNPAYHVPSKARIQAAVSAFTDLKRANAIVWPGPDIDVLDIGPKSEMLDFSVNYRQADQDILRALHVSPMLIDGTAVNQSQNWVAFLSTEVGIDYLRHEIENIFTSIGRDFAIANGMEDYQYLYYKFDNQLLRNPEVFYNFAIKMYELGAISTKTVLNMMGYSFENELNEKQRANDAKEHEIFINKSIPYQGNAPAQAGGNQEAATTKDEAPEEKAALLYDREAFRDMYKKDFTALKQAVNTMLNSVSKTSSKKTKDSIKDVIDSIINSYFTNTEGLLSVHISYLFNFMTKGNPSVRHKLNEITVSQLAYWEKFRDSFIEKFNECYSTFDAKGMMHCFDSNMNRLGLYSTQTYDNVSTLTRLLMAQAEGRTSVKIKCKNSTSCSKALESHGLEMSIEDAINKLPFHPNCTCDFDIL